MSAVPNRQQFLRTLEAIDARQAEYEAALAARADEEDRRNVWVMLAKVDRLMSDPTECEIRDANYAAINASMDRARDAALVRLGYIDAPAYGEWMREDAA